MDPASIGLVFSAVSGVFQIFQGFSDRNTETENALNAQVDAKQALAVGEADRDRQRRIVAAKQSELIAQTGASGTEFTGSPMTVFLENAKQGELEAQDKLFEGQLRARGLNVQAQQHKQAASSALLGGVARGVGTLGSTLLSARSK